MKDAFTIVRNIESDAYAAFLRISTEFCDKFLLVIQDGAGTNANLEIALNRLSRFLISTQQTTSWPGTNLLAGTAQLNEYKLNTESVRELLSLSDNLYAWRQPNLPEDLALLRSDGTIFLGSISHENDAFLELTRREYDLLMAKVPGARIELSR